MISNRWSLRQDFNPDNYLAYHFIRGTAVFRQDLLQLGGLGPDMLRAMYVPPVPLGFRRMRPIIELSSDNTIAIYEIQDEQLAFNFPGGAYYNASRIEVFEDREYLLVNPFGKY